MINKKMSIKREVFYWGLLSFVLIMAVFGIMLIKPDFDRGISKARNSIKYENQDINSYVESFFRETDEMLRVLSKNSGVIEGLSEGKAPDSILELYRILTVTDENLAYVYSGYSDRTMIINDYVLPEGFDPRERPWYKAALEMPDGIARVSYRDIVSEEWMFSSSKAIVDENGEVLGVVAVDVSSDKVSDILKSSAQYDTRRSFLMDSDKKIIVHSEDEFLGQNIKDIATGIDRGELRGPEGWFDYTIDGKEIWGYYSKIDGTDFYSVTSIDSSEVVLPLLDRVGVLIIMITTCAVLIGFFQNMILKKRFVIPFMELSERVKSIAEERENIRHYDSFKNRELIELAQDIETIAKKSIEDRERLLRLSEDRYKKLIDNLSKDYFIYILDKDGEMTYVSPSVEDMLGYSPSEFIRIGNRMGIEARSSDEESFSYEVETVHRDGSRKSVEVTESLLKDEDGIVIGLEGVAKDITEAKDKQKKIEYLSFYDSMTGLYNRRFFEEELKRLDAERNYPLTLLYADINGLKLANDVFGHLVGDELIVKVAENIRRECRKDDIISRMGGDEFAIILPNTDKEEVKDIVKRINSGLSKEQIGELVASVSFGWATKSAPGEPMEDILKKADEYMYKKKLYESPEMRKNTVEYILKKSQDREIVREDLREKELSLLEKLGKELNLSYEEIKRLKEAYRLRNIGQIALEPEILEKIGKLTDEEWKSMKRHPELGYRILSATPKYADIAEYVMSHHERWDGGGYPKGIGGVEIPKLARIIAIVEAYVAMIEGTPYNGEIKNREEVKSELEKNSGTQFDPNILEVFLSILG